MPRNRVPNTAAIMTIVRAAFFGSGWRNAVTPFEITSTPVKAVHPEEKARSSKNSEIDSKAVSAAAV